MSQREDPRQLRERKLEELASLGLPYLPNRFGPTRPSTDVSARFDALEGSTVRVAGRLVRVRVMGKASFAHLQDASGQIQLYFKRDILGDAAYQYFKLLDLGDIIGVEGRVFKTHTGEVSIEVSCCVLLAKALVPLPEKWHGLTDVETRYRRRYLDLISNDEARNIFRIRSAVVRATRRFLDARGFMEVETPVLQPLYGGASSTPFVTRYEALDLDVYLRISDELYLKRLIVGGLERVYEIGKDFRNEGISRKHSPEFTMLELYQAYADYRDIMELFETMIATVAEEVLGTATICFDDHEIDLSPPWRRVSLRDAILRQTGIDIDELTDREQLLAAVRSLPTPIRVADDATRGKIMDEIISATVEPTFIQPTFLYDHPVDFPGGLLAKRSRVNPNLTERFEAFLGGMELANAFTELNEPGDQLARMEEAARLRGDEYAHVDRDYVSALEYGMPPTGGLGFGIDRLVMLFTNARHVRETILFPLLRPKDFADAEP